jgi:hypothetical protein
MPRVMTVPGTLSELDDEIRQDLDLRAVSWIGERRRGISVLLPL